MVRFLRAGPINEAPESQSEDEEEAGMELETLVGYLMALALPLWLLVEFVTYAWRSEPPEKPLVDSDRLPGSPVTRASSTAPPGRAMDPARPRKAA